MRRLPFGSAAPNVSNDVSNGAGSHQTVPNGNEQKSLVERPAMARRELLGTPRSCLAVRRFEGSSPFASTRR
jgi:hypothetical protein